MWVASLKGTLPFYVQFLGAWPSVSMLSVTPYRTPGAVIAHFYRRKLRHRVAELPVQGHTVSSQGGLAHAVSRAQKMKWYSV